MQTMNLNLDESKNHQAYLKYLAENGGEYEPEVRRIIHQILGENDVFVDCGAHIGYFSLMASQLCLKVYAFEAEKENYESLISNIEDNEITNIVAYHKAVGDKNEKVELMLNLDNDGGHALWDVRVHPQTPQTKKLGKRTQKVEMVTLDDTIKDPVKLIKIDVEGCEFKVLKGAEGILKKYRPSVILEINDGALIQMGTSKDEIIKFMSELGYTGYDLETNGLLGETEHEFVYNVIFLPLNTN